MKKAFGAIPKIPRPPKVPSAPNAPAAPSMGPPGAPGGGAAASPPGGTGARGVPGDVHALPGKLIKRIKAAIARRLQSDVGSDAHIERVMRAFPLDNYRDADGNVRCPVSKERRKQLKSTFGD
jgi:hypothetical protein